MSNTQTIPDQTITVWHTYSYIHEPTLPGYTGTESWNGHSVYWTHSFATPTYSCEGMTILQTATATATTTVTGGGGNSLEQPPEASVDCTRETPMLLNVDTDYDLCDPRTRYGKALGFHF